MIQVEKLSYGFPDKDLYKDISFTLAAGQHCALIGSNGCGKSTLVDLLMRPDKYWFDGKVLLDEGCRIGYASQFSVRDKVQDCSVFDYLAERFTTLSAQISAACDAMAAPDLDEAELDRLFASYQALLDQSEAMDAEHYESAIRKQLHAAGMRELEHTRLADVSGGEYKLLQIMREMLLAPNLLVLDEPDVFLDFENLNGLCRLINDYPGTLLAVTHNRYLLQHCFNKILHLENTDLQEFDGTYGAYRCALLREKLALRLQHIEEQAEIARTEQMVESLRKRATLMVNPTIGQAVNAKQSQLERLLARQIKAPFIEVREPQITLPEVTVDGSAAAAATQTAAAAENEEMQGVGDAARGEDAAGSGQTAPEPRVVLQVSDYAVKFDEYLLRDVNFAIRAGEKVALIGPNGAGKWHIIRTIVLPCSAISSNRKIRRYRLTRIRRLPVCHNWTAARRPRNGLSLRCSRTRGCRAGRRCGTVWRRIRCRRGRCSRRSASYPAESRIYCSWRYWRAAARSCCCSMSRPVIWICMHRQRLRARWKLTAGPYSW